MQLLCGEIGSNGPSTDQETGEHLQMTEIIWLGGNQYIVGETSSDLARLKEGQKVLVGIYQKKGKKGYYNDRDKPTRILTVDGKPTETRAVAS